MADSAEVSYVDLVTARAPALLRLALMLTGNKPDADDLFQSALVRAHRHRARIERMDAPNAYLRQIVVNEHLSRRRTAARRPATVAMPDERAADTDLEAEVGERDAVWRSLETLPPRQRAVLVLRFYEDLDDTSIGAILGCTPGTVRAHVSKALATLRHRLDDQEQLT